MLRLGSGKQPVSAVLASNIIPGDWFVKRSVTELAQFGGESGAIQGLVA